MIRQQSNSFFSHFGVESSEFIDSLKFLDQAWFSCIGLSLLPGLDDFLSFFLSTLQLFRDLINARHEFGKPFSSFVVEIYEVVGPMLFDDTFLANGHLACFFFAIENNSFPVKWTCIILYKSKNTSPRIMLRWAVRAFKLHCFLHFGKKRFIIVHAQ